MQRDERVTALLGRYPLQIAAFSALFGISMMLTAPDGCVHADADVADWMEAAGFTGIDRKPFPPPMPHRVVTGVKP